ncbi:hypothetical protein IQ269_23465 [Tychonema sp. LEGE 07199]|uniref:hypothetical protein n=1 Tax=unclassified Tychonema TaxID=2642144 RepID=UPI00187F1D94|nr:MULTISPECIES: hypothetical protein [unclassified Tychonema]MBE9123678.1 hypothetical protein [Tychonema sp. LEGE 07199]MBE9135045.1 hypothetical protein [Tychonema sp. LEGE 07196]
MSVVSCQLSVVSCQLLVVSCRVRRPQESLNSIDNFTATHLIPSQQPGAPPSKIPKFDRQSHISPPHKDGWANKFYTSFGVSFLINPIVSRRTQQSKPLTTQANSHIKSFYSQIIKPARGQMLQPIYKNLQKYILRYKHSEVRSPRARKTRFPSRS